MILTSFSYLFSFLFEYGPDSNAILINTSISSYLKYKLSQHIILYSFLVCFIFIFGFIFRLFPFFVQTAQQYDIYIICVLFWQILSKNLVFQFLKVAFISIGVKMYNKGCYIPTGKFNRK